MPNSASIINSHNKKIINNNIPKPSAPTFNCRSKTSRPLNSNCFQSSLVYISKADTQDINKNHLRYIGSYLKNDFTNTKTDSNRTVNVMQRNYQILYGKINMPTLKRILCRRY